MGWYKLGVEFCEARLAGIVEDEDGVDHGACLVELEMGRVGCHRILGLRVCLGLLSGMYEYEGLRQNCPAPFISEYRDY